MPQAPRKMAQVTVMPMRIPSTFPISGNCMTFQRKYTELEMMDAESTSRTI